MAFLSRAVANAVRSSSTTYRVVVHASTAVMGARSMSRTALAESESTRQPKRKPEAKSTKQAKADENELNVRLQLSRVAQLQRRVAAVNTKAGKTAIIAEYPDLRELLEFIYEPKTKLNLTPTTLVKHMTTGTVDFDGIEGIPYSLIDMFLMLGEREVTGNAAKNLVTAFLVKHQVVTEEGDLDSEPFDTFCRLVNRNLLAGFGANTLKDVEWGAVEAEAEASSGGKQASEKSKATASTETRAAKRTEIGASFSCALGRSIEPASFGKLVEGSSTWYASRKLDGVRCITEIDFAVPADPDTPPWILDVHFKSRTGNSFTSLSKLKDALDAIAGFPRLREWLDRDPVVLGTAPGQGDPTDEVPIKRLVLDGEVCVMREQTSAEAASARAAAKEAEHDDGSTGTGSAVWTNDGLVEDFSMTVSQVRRKNAAVANPRYYIFDVLSYAEFASHGAVPDAPGLAQPFSARAADVQALSDYLASTAESTGAATPPPIRAVTQREVTSRGVLDAMVARAASEGWEGLMFRRGEALYIGKRSSDIYKFKHWLDAEYEVVGFEIGKQRLSVAGLYGELDALSAVWIEHSGHRVSVGSGFTTDQRLRYAKDPDLIVGKQITVQYFGESEANDRDAGVRSLRFPRVKRVWDDGGRDV